MVEHRKYLPRELDYVLSRVAAGWKFEIIAKAFKKQFASHWAYRLFTKKQVQYIRNTYKRPPGTIKPYEGPVPVFSPSPQASPQNHTADLQATMNAAMNVDHYGQLNSEGRQQANNVIPASSQPASQPTMAGDGYQGQQQYVADVDMFARNPLSPYEFNTLPAGTSSGPDSTMMSGALNPMLGSHYTEAAPSGVTNNNYQPNALVGNGTQFPYMPQMPQMPQWNQTVPTPSAHARFSGYASQVQGHVPQATPSLQNSLLNTPTTDHVLSGEHTERLLRGPPVRLERLLHDEGPADGFDLTQIATPETLLMRGALRGASENLMSGALGGTPETYLMSGALGGTPEPLKSGALGGGENQSQHVQDPVGCSIENTSYTDRSGWWYNGHHDGWCCIPNEHRHDYDGGMYFSSYASYTQNIYNEQNDQLTGFFLGLSEQLQNHKAEGEPMCLHQSCQEAQRVAQDLIDATQPEGHHLRQAPLRQPHPVVIRLLRDLNGRLPEGYVYDPISQRVVQYDLGGVGEPEPHDESANSVQEGGFQLTDGQETG